MRTKSEFAGKEVSIKSGTFKRTPYLVEDWVENVMGKSWMDCNGNPACLKYAVRAAGENLPMNDEVLYGKIGTWDELIHINEIKALNEN